MNLQRMLWCTLIAIMVWIAMMLCEGAAFRQPCVGKSHLSYIACHSAPVADLELAADAPHFQDLVDQRDSVANRRWNAEVIRVNTCMDFLFILLYWLTFVFLAKDQYASVTTLNPSHYPWGFAVVTALISVAALLDIWENVRLMSALSKLSDSLNVFTVPGAVAQAKWLVFAAALFFLGLSLLRNRTFWKTAMSALMLLSALLTAWGVWHTRVLPFAVALLSIALLIAVFRYFPVRPFGRKEFFACIEFAYLIRFQLVAAFLLAILLPAGYFLAPSIFIGMFDALAFWSFVFVTAAALYLAWCIMLTIRLVFVYGRERFSGIDPLPAAAYLNWPTALTYAALASPCLVMLFCGTTSLQWPYKSVATFIGVAIAVLVLWLMARLHYCLEPDTGDTASKIFPFQFLRARKSAPPSPPAAVTTPNSPSLNDGIHRAGGAGSVHSGHQLAGAALIASVILYLLIGLAYKPSLPGSASPAAAAQVSAEAAGSESPAATLMPHAGKAHPPAAIFYLFFLLTIFVLLFSGIAFLLDKVRLPVFSSVLSLSFLLGVAGTDHLYAIKSTSKPSPPTPADAFHAWENVRSKGQPDKPLIVVATAGGGIRAAAWTTQVLTGLSARCNGSGEPDRDNFSSSLLLISSVSGGSLGNMYFAGSYETDGRLRQDLLPKIRNDAARTSLSSIGWGLLFPDFLRTVPFVGSALAPQDVDRGWSLETQWLNNWNGRNWQSPPMLREWGEDVRNGKRPVTIFNATAAESGQRYILASTVFQEEDPGARQFAKDFPAYDIPVSTAARVSAAFPWVSPMPRAMTSTSPLGLHLADGGYYDNSGMLNATKWLLETACEIHKHPVLFIAIDASPATPKEGQKWSWQRQAAGPIEALLAVRDSSQVSRGKYERDLALDQLRAKGIAVREFDMRYSPDPLSPLSWHLTREQKARIADAWADSTVTANREQIAQTLHCP